LHGDFRIFDPSRLHDLEAETLDRGDNLAHALAFEVLRFESGSGEKEGDALKEIHFQDLPAD
jgi:hypothetical protein